MESGAKPQTQPHAFALVITTLVLAGLFYAASAAVDVAEVSRNWPKYRCTPQVMPFASLYGYDTAENFNYCLKTIFEGQLGGTTGPFAEILTSMTKSLMVFLQNINSMRVQITTMVAGIGKMFQEFTDRFKVLFGQIKFGFLKLQMLMRRVYGVFFSVIYLGMSAIQVGNNFTENIIFKFADTFCFAPETMIFLQNNTYIPISQVKKGDVLFGGAKVTSTYRFAANGQPMVSIRDIEVSTNHYVQHEGKWIQAVEHPEAFPAPAWTGGNERPLICLDTDTHQIPLRGLIFSDWDETEVVDNTYMLNNEQLLNGGFIAQPQPYTWPFRPALAPKERVALADGTTKPAEEIQLGDLLPYGKVIGIGKRETSHLVLTPRGSLVTPSTLVWEEHKWVRAGHLAEPTYHDTPVECIALTVLSSSMIELASGDLVRDMVEVFSPDTDEVVRCALMEPEKNNLTPQQG